MAKASAKFGIALIAALLVGAGVFAFVAYTTYDAIGFGKVVTYEEFVSLGAVNGSYTLQYSAESEPVVTIWKGATGATFNGTVNAARVSFDGGKVVTITSTIWTVAGSAYPLDTTYLKFNYTGQGSAARAITMPAIVLVSVFAIVVIAGVMINQTGSLGGKKGGGRKSFP